MDARDLTTFEAVARLGGMGRAARELNTVQSNVTQRVRRLEETLGVLLFERSRAGARLTPAGQRLMPYATRVGALLDEAGRAARDDGAPRGTLTVGSLETTAALRLSPLLASYVRAHPGVDVVLRTGTTAEMVERVLNRDLEGAFEVTVQDALDHLGGRARAQHDVDAGMGAYIGGEQGRQPQSRRRLQRTYGQRAARRAIVASGAAGLVEQGAHARRIGHQPLAGRGETRAGPAAFEQQDAQRLFEASNPLRDVRLHRVQFPRGAAHAAETRYRLERGQIPSIHGIRISDGID